MCKKTNNFENMRKMYLNQLKKKLNYIQQISVIKFYSFINMFATILIRSLAKYFKFCFLMVTFRNLIL